MSSSLKPASVFECFAQVNQVPRPSKREEKMIEFLLNYGKSLSLPTRRDEAGNVIITKPATPGMEGRPTVILQSHMDMVCEKNADVQFDFDKDAIQTYVDGEWMRAKGTTLGADDGIGVAMSLVPAVVAPLPPSPTKRRQHPKTSSLPNFASRDSRVDTRATISIRNVPMPTSCLLASFIRN